MFQSYTLQPNQDDDLYIITDSDFQETVDCDTKSLAEYIIEVYSKRNLNVAKNLFLFMQFINKKFGDGWSIDNQISWYKESVKDFDKYLPEIKKYLSLI